MLKKKISSLELGGSKRRILSWSFVLILVMVIPLSACTTSTLMPASSALADFQHQRLTIDPVIATPGEGVVITTQVNNIGEIEGDYTIQLMVNGITAGEKQATIPAGETYTFKFLESETTPGTYQIILGELTGEFEVIELSELSQGTSQESEGIGFSGASCCGGGSDITESETDNPETKTETSGGCGCGCSDGCGG